MKFLDKLVKLGACQEALDWVGDRTKQQALADCERADWMLWYLAKTVKKCGDRQHRLLVNLACDCAETALQHVFAGGDRARLAIEAARRWAADPSINTAAAVDAAYAVYTAAVYAAYAERHANKQMCDLIRASAQKRAGKRAW